MAESDDFAHDILNAFKDVFWAFSFAFIIKFWLEVQLRSGDLQRPRFFETWWFYLFGATVSILRLSAPFLVYYNYKAAGSYVWWVACRSR
jgi:hypothetical protein